MFYALKTKKSLPSCCDTNANIIMPIDASVEFM